MAYIGNTPAESFASFEKQVFTIVNSQTAYTLSHSVVNENDIRLVVNNVVQEPGSGKAYTASGTTLTLSAALVNGTDEMYCVFLGRALQTVNPPNASVGTAQLVDDAVTADKLASGAVANTPSFRAYMSAAQTISDNTNTVVQYNTENFDTDSAYDTSTYRFTVPSGKAGKYFFSAHAYIFQSGATLYACDFQIRKNGTNQSADSLALDSSDNFGYIVKTNTILDLSVGDYIDCNVIGNTNDGGTLSVFNTSPYQFSVFQGFKLI